MAFYLCSRCSGVPASSERVFSVTRICMGRLAKSRESRGLFTDTWASCEGTINRSSPTSALPVALILFSPLAVSGSSVVPVCRPFKDHSVSPCRTMKTRGVVIVVHSALPKCGIWMSVLDGSRSTRLRSGARWGGCRKAQRLRWPYNRER